MGSMENNHKILAKESEAFATAARVKYYDIVIDSGRGAILTDVDGNQYIDLLPSAGFTTTGHCNPKVVKAFQNQAPKFIKNTQAYFANSQAPRLPPRLPELARM